MLNDIFRTLMSFLSVFYFNKGISNSKDIYISDFIKKKIKTFKINKNNLKKTHIEFNKEILNLVKNGDLKNFLRKNFIQKMFFVHNRIFILRELNQLKNSHKWKFYEKLLVEDSIGNPIRYFLYPKSSGNRINHVYHLKVMEDELKINLKKDIKKVFEFGAGYGCMARIFSKISNKINYICFDTNYVNLLQFYYLKHINLDVGYKKKNKIYLISSLKKNSFKSDLFIANWSLSEVPLIFRENFFKVISSSKYILICFQEKFENINNLDYFSSLKMKLSKEYKIVIKRNLFYRGNFFFKQKHYFFLAKKL